MGDSLDHLWAAVQAVGTIISVLAAVWVGYAAIRAENKRNKARGRVTAFRLAPDMVNLIGDVSRARTVLVELRKGFQTPVVSTMVGQMGALRMAHGIPQDVFGESWTLPPHIALAVAQLDNALNNHEGMMVNAEGWLFVPSDEAKAQFYQNVEVSLSAIERLAIEIKNYSGEVADAVVRERRRLAQNQAREGFS